MREEVATKASPTGEDPLLGTGAAARYMTERGHKVSRFTIIRRVADGEIAATRTPAGQARIKRSVLDRYIASLR